MNTVPINKKMLFEHGVKRATLFCEKNKLPHPNVLAVEDTGFGACAYYRPQTITISIAQCATPKVEGQMRNWNWWGNTVDREPGGVICHELGHHVDWTCSDKKATYSGNLSKRLMEAAGETSISGYEADLPHEWFAEMFRLFVTNHALLRLLRPKTHKLFSELWKPVSHWDWKAEMGANCPKSVLRAAENKIKGVRNV